MTVFCFSYLHRDVLNHVYFDKRALFLAGLRKTLEKANKKNGEKYKVFSFEYLKGDVRKPVLSIVPSFSSSVVVRLIPVVRLFIHHLIVLSAVVLRRSL